MLGEILFWGSIIFVFGMTFYMVWCLLSVASDYDDWEEEYWNNYRERKEADGCEEVFATVEETGLHDNE